MAAPTKGSVRKHRVLKHYGAIYGVVKARKRYGCDGHLAEAPHSIQEGELYVASALPPDDPDVGNDRWWHHRLCAGCAPAEYAEALGVAP